MYRHLKNIIVVAWQPYSHMTALTTRLTQFANSLDNNLPQGSDKLECMTVKGHILIENMIVSMT